MSRSQHTKRAPGYQYWKSRGGKRHGEEPGRYTKRKTHKRERKRAQETIDEQQT